MGLAQQEKNNSIKKEEMNKENGHSPEEENKEAVISHLVQDYPFSRNPLPILDYLARYPLMLSICLDEIHKSVDMHLSTGDPIDEMSANMLEELEDKILQLSTEYDMPN